MQNIQSRALAWPAVKSLGLFVVLSSVAFLPFFIHWQWLTGPLVNAMLILALFLLGRPYAFTLCFIPSLMALAGGLLPAPLAPLVPFIMISNLLYVFTLDLIYARSAFPVRAYGLGLLSGAGLKFIFLKISLRLFLPIFLSAPLAAKAGVLFSWTQLATALSGGLIAWSILVFLKRV